MSRPARRRLPSNLSHRRLFVEKLEARIVFDVDFYLDPPPAPYLDDQMDMYVSRVEWEFDEWNKSEIARGPFIQSEDARIMIEDGHVFLSFVARDTDSFAGLTQELDALYVKPVTLMAPYATGWVPLASLKDLKNLSNVGWVFIENTIAVNNITNDIVLSDTNIQSELTDLVVESLTSVNELDPSGKLGFDFTKNNVLSQVASEQVPALTVSAKTAGSELAKQSTPLIETAIARDSVRTLSYTAQNSELKFANTQISLTVETGTTESQVVVVNDDAWRSTQSYDSEPADGNQNVSDAAFTQLIADFGGRLSIRWC